MESVLAESLLSGLASGVECSGDDRPGVAGFASGTHRVAEFGFGVGDVRAGGEDAPEVHRVSAGFSVGSR